jgi:hypothetical protein
MESGEKPPNLSRIGISINCRYLEKPARSIAIGRVFALFLSSFRFLLMSSPRSKLASIPMRVTWIWLAEANVIQSFRSHSESCERRASRSQLIKASNTQGRRLLNNATKVTPGSTLDRFPNDFTTQFQSSTTLSSISLPLGHPSPLSVAISQINSGTDPSVRDRLN